MKSIAIGPRHHATAAAFAAIVWLLASPWNGGHDSQGFFPGPVDWLFGRFPSIFAAAWAYGLSLWIVKRIHFARHGLAWYLASQGMADATAIRCHACGSTHLRSQRMLRHTYTTAVCCARCGTTLYYTPEAG